MRASTIQKAEEALKKVDELKLSARTNRDFEDFDNAHKDLDHAIQLLRPLLKNLVTEKDTGEIENYESLQFNLARNLADCYGMKGGIYRRQEILIQAALMYRKGAEIETNFQIPSTYNRTNVIVLEILLDPNNYKNLQVLIEDSLNVIKQKTEGQNINEWWTWADYGLINLLSAKLKENNQTEDHHRDEARKAYGKFKENGARKHHFESTIDVLEQLEESLKKVDQNTAMLIQEEIDYLEHEMPTR